MHQFCRSIKDVRLIHAGARAFAASGDLKRVDP
jgi:hypothetical protein